MELCFLLLFFHSVRLVKCPSPDCPRMYKYVSALARHCREKHNQNYTKEQLSVFDALNDDKDEHEVVEENDGQQCEIIEDESSQQLLILIYPEIIGCNLHSVDCIDVSHQVAVTFLLQ